MPWNVNQFLTAYIGLPIFLLLFLGWKITKRTRLIPAAEIDLQTGKQALDAMDDFWPPHVPKNWADKVLYRIF